MCEQTKVCNVCKKDLPVSNFYYRKDKGIYRPNCKKCKANPKKDISNRTHKVCKTCGIEKPLSDFQKAGKWHQPYCKSCDNIRKQKHVESNIEKVSAKRKQYYSNNKEVLSQKAKARRELSKEKIKKYASEYRAKHLEEIKQRNKEYRRLNKDKIRDRSRELRELNKPILLKKEKIRRQLRTEEQKAKMSEYLKKYRIVNAEKLKLHRQSKMDKIRQKRRINNNNRSASDPVFRLLKNLRSRTRFALKSQHALKSDTTEKLLGCSIAYFKKHFESLFIDGMTWEAFMKGQIHIDHIKPCSKFDLSIPKQQKECFHYTNLQPLWELDNLKKGVFFDEKHTLCQKKILTR